MSDPLTIVGGIASFAQLVTVVFKTTEAFATFCQSVQDAPSAVYRIHEKLMFLKMSLKSIQTQLVGIDDSEILPPDMCLVLHNAVYSVHKDVAILNRRCQISLNSSSQALRGRLKWALLERHLVSGMVERLRDSEGTLTCALQLLNVRLSLLVYSSSRNSNLTSHEAMFQNHTATRPRITKGQMQKNVLAVDSWLRKCGLYGSISRVRSFDNSQWESRVCVGFKPPRWASSKSISFEFGFASLGLFMSGISILPGQIRLQNQVLLDSPFMKACSEGDMRAIRQCLTEGSGQVGDRAVCCGKTPLMLAIEGNHLHAVQYLLESGADPNIADDDQLLPIFSLLGMSSDKSRKIAQLPPRWDAWIPALRLLVRHGASVHESFREKTLSMLNVIYPPRDEHALDYFHILLSEGYMYWETDDKLGWSALLTAFRSKNQSLQALKFLEGNGVDMSRILTDGRSALHIAAEHAEETVILDHIWDRGCSGDLNRQDQWGWTPLHYSIAAAYINPCTISIQRMSFLLHKGADINIKGKHHPGLFWPELPPDDFTPVEMCRALSGSLYSQLSNEIKLAGRICEICD